MESRQQKEIEMKTAFNRLLRLNCLLLLLAGAFPAQAFYNPITGRWLSRDPLGEKIDRNLHLFVRNNPIAKIDVVGLATIETPDQAATACQQAINKKGSDEAPTPSINSAECTAALEQMFKDPEVLKYWEKYNRQTCPPPVFQCMCCPKNVYGWSSSGESPPFRRRVFLCLGGMKDNPAEFKKTLIHELTHDLQSCCAGDDNGDCVAHIKREIEASYCESPSTATFPQCIGDAVYSSCYAGGSCNPSTVRAAFDELRTWFNAEKDNFCKFPRLDYPCNRTGSPASTPNARSCNTCR